LLITLDIVCNNSDRLPALWDNTGNLENITVSENSEIVGIDNGTACLNLNSPGFQRYQDRVSRFLGALLADPTQETPEIARVRTSIRNHGMDPVLVAEMGIPEGFDIGTAGSAVIQQGVLEGLARFAQMEPHHVEAFVQMVHHANQTYDWGDVWLTGVESTPRSFFEAIIGTIRPHREAVLAALSNEQARISSGSKLWAQVLELVGVLDPTASPPQPT
jgi:hypothetical protein